MENYEIIKEDIGQGNNINKSKSILIQVVLVKYVL